MTTIGLVGAGHMGSGIGWALRAVGHEVLTALGNRSERSRRLATAAGISIVDDLPTVVRRAGLLLVVTPPGAALAAAGDIAEAATTTGARPLVADLNAIAPSTVEDVARILAAAGLELVDGSISGAPPNVRPGALVYLSGPRASDVAELGWRHIRPVVVGDRVGQASAVKMCTASVYKGLSALLTQALRTAGHHGVLDVVVADLAELDPEPQVAMAMAATKAHRYVAEMLEISSTQDSAGLPAALFAAFAEVYAGIAETPLAAGDPETVDRTRSAAAVVAELPPTPRRPR